MCEAETSAASVVVVSIDDLLVEYLLSCVKHPHTWHADSQKLIEAELCFRRL